MTHVFQVRNCRTLRRLKLALMVVSLDMNTNLNVYVTRMNKPRGKTILLYSIININ